MSVNSKVFFILTVQREIGKQEKSGPGCLALTELTG